MSLAVLITCHNRKESTLVCLEKLYSQTGIDIYFHVETFLVDDGSNDCTADAVKNKYPAINIIQGSGNLYWNRGMHLAWKTAASSSNRFDFYIWLNDDTNLFPEAITELLEVNSMVNTPAIVCGAIRSNKNIQFTYGGRTKSGVEIIPNNQIQYCHTMNGNCVLIPDEVFQKVGNLDPVFPHSIGDIDYSLRAAKKKIVLITTKKYIGCCERNTDLPKWCYKKVPLKNRLKALYSPLGNSHPYYFFIYEMRHFGLFIAVKHYLSIHLRMVIPQLWK